jgi:hypothetical protein
MPVRPLDGAGLRRLTADGTALLVTWEGGVHTYVWWLDDAGLVAFAVSADARPGRVARRLHANLSAASPLLRPQVEADAASLSRALLAPLAGRLGTRRLAVVADGALAAVPWPLLPAPAGAGRLLVDDHETVRLPSASLVAALRRRAARRGGAAPGGPWWWWAIRCTARTTPVSPPPVGA